MSKQIAIALLVLSSTAHAGQVYKCTNQSGKVTYQDTPCTKGTQSIMTPPPLPSTPKPAPNTTIPSATPTTPNTPAPTVAPSTPSPKPKVNPDLSITENCSVDNPNRDPEFCRPSNLQNVYGRPLRPVPRSKPAP